MSTVAIETSSNFSHQLELPLDKPDLVTGWKIYISIQALAESILSGVSHVPSYTSLSILISFSLVYGTIPTLRPVRAEARSPYTKVLNAQPITKPHKRGEIIVKFKQDVPQWVRDQVIQTYAKSEKKLRGRNKANKLTIKDGLDLGSTVFDLKQLDAVIEYAEPNYLVTRTGNITQAVGPNDPQFPVQWALSNTGQNNGAPGSDIGVMAGWQKTTGARDTIIAIIDTGIDFTHPDLARNLWINKREANGKKHEDDDRDGYIDNILGWNFVNDSNDVADDHGHGTAMAGIIAAEGDNRLGMTGVLRRRRMVGW